MATLYFRNTYRDIAGVTHRYLLETQGSTLATYSQYELTTGYVGTGYHRLDIGTVSSTGVFTYTATNQAEREFIGVRQTNGTHSDTYTDTASIAQITIPATHALTIVAKPQIGSQSGASAYFTAAAVSSQTIVDAGTWTFYRSLQYSWRYEDEEWDDYLVELHLKVGNATHNTRADGLTFSGGATNYNKTLSCGVVIRF
jgi:hypothetical protein